MTDPAPAPETGTIARQHERLFETVRSIEEMLPIVAQRNEAKALQHALRSLLDYLSDQLHQHFAAEEQDDYFPRIAAREPRLARKVAELVRDHVELRALAAGLAEQGRKAHRSSDWAQISLQFWQLRERLAWHEREENEVAFQVHNVDLGAASDG